MLWNEEPVVSTWQYEPDYWNLKPPLSEWFIMLGCRIFGFNAWGLRFYSALSIFLTGLLCTVSALFPAGGWAAARFAKDGTRFFTTMVSYDLVDRTSQTLEGHSGGVVYYFRVLYQDLDHGVLLLLLTVAAVGLLQLFRNHHPPRPGVLLLGPFRHRSGRTAARPAVHLCQNQAGMVHFLHLSVRRTVRSHGLPVHAGTSAGRFLCL